MDTQKKMNLRRLCDEGPALGWIFLPFPFPKILLSVLILFDHFRSRLSVVCQNWSRVNLKFAIPGSAFVPKPDVDVAAVTMHPLTVPYIEHPFPIVNKVVTVVFQGKKKMLHNTIKNLFPDKISGYLTKQVFEEELQRRFWRSTL